MKAKKTLLITITLIMCFCIGSGADSTNTEDTTEAEDTTTATDYSNTDHWLSLPVTGEKEVDVFYLYPTVWQKLNVNEPNICEIDNASMIAGSKLAFEKQATAFETVGNIFAPYYRQVDAGYCLSLSAEEHEKIVVDIPSTDAIAAFDYYIKYYNKGRPFILAGHSQGSNVLLYLLSDYMKENPEVLERMIAAYVIGYSVTDEYLAQNAHLKFAEGPDDTGVIISYNTEGPVVEGINPVVLPGSIAINPINWSRGVDLAAADENLGSIITNADGSTSVLEHYADAKVDTVRGTVICSTIDEEEAAKISCYFPKGVYHNADYSLYYYNIRENAANRTEVYLSRLNPFLLR